MQLLPHQIVGRDFLIKNRHALLADDMRVGKAVQSIAAADLLESLIGAPLICVITQATVVKQWQRQFQSFGVYQRRPFVFSYEEANEAHRAVIKRQHWDIMVLDESHMLKERTSARTRAVYGKDCHGDGLVSLAEKVWCLTGTPSPNNAAELWSMLRALFPEVITHEGKILTYTGFVRKYCKVANFGFGPKITGNKNIDELKRRMAPIMLRRPRSILGNQMLPPEVLSLDDEGALASLEKELRDLLEHDQKEKLDRARTPEQVEAVMARIDAGVRGRLLQIVGIAKCVPLIALLKNELESGLDKVVLFCWHGAVANALREGLAEYSPAVVVGETPIPERQKEVDAFQQDPKRRVFVGNIKAAGVGLDLSAACELIFAETSWVPGDNDQASMRVSGINQKRAVRVRYAVLPGSLDERLTEVNRRKSRDIGELFG